MKDLIPRTRPLWPIASLLLALGAGTGLQAQAQSMQIPKPSEHLMPNPAPAVTPDDGAHITAYVRMEQRKVGIC